MLFVVDTFKNSHHTESTHLCLAWNFASRYLVGLPINLGNYVGKNNLFIFRRREPYKKKPFRDSGLNRYPKMAIISKGLLTFSKTQVIYQLWVAIEIPQKTNQQLGILLVFAQVAPTKPGLSSICGLTIFWGWVDSSKTCTVHTFPSSWNGARLLTRALPQEKPRDH